MKIAILGDCHLGMRKDSPKFHKHAEKFFDLFFSYTQKHGIQHIIQLGDLFDNRKSVSQYTAFESRRYFFSKFSKYNQEYPYTLYTLLGNHDIYWRESLAINTPSEVLGYNYDIHIVDKPTTIELDDVLFDFIPWICEENRDQCMKYIANSTSDYCFGHFEISGASMYRGTHAIEGLGTEYFKDYKRVFSGHFHTQSTMGNIQYVGTPYEITWEDCGDPRGFHILDIDTGEIEFIENPHTMFEVVEYDNGLKANKATLAEKIVKVVVKNKDNLYDFENTISSINNSGIYDLKIIENVALYSGSEVDESIELKDTLSILKSYIDSSDIENADKVKEYMQALYLNAINIEVV